MFNKDAAFELMIGKPSAIDDFMDEVEKLDEEIRADAHLARQKRADFKVGDVVWYQEDDGEWLLATITSYHSGAFQLVDAWGNEIVDRDFFHDDFRATGRTWNDIWMFFHE